METINRIALIALSLVVSSCAGVSNDATQAGPDSQRMVTTFKREGVKLDWSCRWGTGITKATCIQGDLIGIEVTGYAPSFGVTQANREVAFQVANDVALAKLARFLDTDVKTTRTTKLLSRNLEKTNQLVATGQPMPEEVSVSEDARPVANANSERLSTSNNIVRTMVQTIATSSQRILRGVRVIDEKIVDPKTVSVTVRWDVDSDSARRAISDAMVR